MSDTYLQLKQRKDVLCKFNLLPGGKRGAPDEVIYSPVENAER
jgi:hypothetical protein